MKGIAATHVEKGGVRNPVKPHNALDLLEAEHHTLRSMFRDYNRAATKGQRLVKGKLALRTCHLLSLHDLLEEEIFYPSAARVLGDKARHLLAVARVEHAAVNNLIGKLENMKAGDPLFDATLQVLAAQSVRHFDEEEQALFPLVRRSKLDLAGLGEQMASRELELSTRRLRKGDFREGRRVLGH